MVARPSRALPLLLTALAACGDDGGAVTETDVVIIGDAGDGSGAPDAKTPDAADENTDAGTASDALDDVGEDVDVTCVDNLDCRGGEVCRDGVCRTVCLSDNDCDQGLTCDNGECVERAVVVCTPFELGCVDVHTAYVCSEDGNAYDEFACRDDQFCVDGVCAVVACEPSTSYCDGQSVVTCTDDGAIATSQPCASLERCADSPGGCDCRGAECVELACVPRTTRCVGNATQTCDATGSAWGAPEVCSEPYCVNGECTDELCAPGTSTCDGERAITCPADGGTPTTIDCASSGRLCSGGGCVAPVCEAGTYYCNSEQTAVVTCDARGASESTSNCPPLTYCSDGECTSRLCEPGEGLCDGDDLLVCNEIGSLYDFVDTCVGGCSAGACSDPCAAGAGTNIGCEFVTADLPNYRQACGTSTDCSGIGISCSGGYCTPSAYSLPTRIYVTNEFDQDNAVVISSRTGTILGSSVVAAGSGVADFPITSSLWRTTLGQGVIITSEFPISVRQDNNPGGSTYFSTDAALVLPTHSTGQNYVVASSETVNFGLDASRAFVTIIGTADGTTVNFTPTTETVAAAGGTPAAIPALTTRTFTLGRGEAIQFATSNVGGSDFTGSLIDSSAPVAVFAGHECAQVPLGTSFCDHWEEQLLPNDAASIEIVYARSFARGTEPDVVRIIATEDNTTITTVPVIVGVSGAVLDAGQYIQALVSSDTYFRGTAPLLATSYIVGTAYGPSAIPNSPLCTTVSQLGDPAVAFIPPVSSTAGDHTFVVPSGYIASYVSVAARVGTSVWLDSGAVATATATVNGYRIYRIPVASTGRHVLSADGGVSAILTMYGCGWASMLPVALDYR